MIEYDFFPSFFPRVEYMSNSIWAMRMLNQLRGPSPALMPLDDGRESREKPRESREKPKEKPRGRRRDSRSPSPVRRKRKARSPSSSSEEISESDYSSYDEAEVIKSRYKKEPCEYVSPAGLADKKTKKEVVNYLEEKQCPKIEKHAKRKHVPKTIAEQQSESVLSVAPKSESAPVVTPATGISATGGGAVAPPGEDAIEKRGKGRPKGPVKIKKPPTAYNLAVGRHMKTGKTMAEASKLAREELAKKE